MLVRFVYLAVVHVFAALRLLSMTDREKDVEILALRHQLTILQRQLGDHRPRLRSEDRIFLSMLLVPLSRVVLRRLRLLVSPDTVLRWHRDLVKHRHARARVNRGPGRSRTLASIRRLVLRLAAENPSWGYRRIRGELALLGVKVAPSTVWEILKTDGVDPAPQRATSGGLTSCDPKPRRSWRWTSSRPSPLPGGGSTSSLPSTTLAGGSAFSVPPRTPPMPG